MKNCFWVLFSLHILLLSCSGSCKSKKDVNFIKKNAISDVNNGCTEDEITDRNSVTIAYRDSLLSQYDGLKYFSYTKSVGDDSYSMEIETFCLNDTLTSDDSRYSDAVPIGMTRPVVIKQRLKFKKKGVIQQIIDIPIKTALRTNHSGRKIQCLEMNIWQIAAIHGYKQTFFEVSGTGFSPVSSPEFTGIYTVNGGIIFQGSTGQSPVFDRKAFYDQYGVTDSLYKSEMNYAIRVDIFGIATNNLNKKLYNTDTIPLSPRSTIKSIDELERADRSSIWHGDAIWLVFHKNHVDFLLNMNAASFSYKTRIVNKQKMIFIWDYDIRSSYDLGLKKSFGLSHRPVKGKPFGEFILVNDTTIHVNYYYPEWVELLNKHNNETVFPTTFVLDPRIFNNGCTEDEITDRNSVTIAYRDSLLSLYGGLKYFSYTKSVGNDSYSMEIETFPDTISVSEENGICYTVIKRNGLVLDIRQRGDLFSNGRIYCKHSEYNDSCLSTKVTWFLDDTIKLLSYEETAAFIKDSIYDINYDGVNDLVLTYSIGSSTSSDIYLFGHNGMVLREKVLRNYFPLLDGEFIQSDSYRSGIVFFQKLKWNELQIDTLEQIYYDVADKRSYIVPPLEIDENGTYDKNKKAMPINKMLDKCFKQILV